VHHTALENARTKAVAEAQAKWDQEYGWAKDPRMAEASRRVAQFQGNPLGLVAELVRDLAPHPELGPQLRSFLGQQFGALRQRSAAPVEEPPQPDVEIRNDQGQVVGHTYSAEAQAKRETFLKRQWMQEVQQAFGPRLQTLDTIAQREADAEMQRQADSFGASFFQEISALPGFDVEKHGKAMAEELALHPLPQNAHPDVVRANAYRAYTKVVLPELQSSAVRSVVATQQQKAGVNTASPQTGSTGTPKSYADMTWSEAFQHELAARR
jgi:hypothetical protein